MIKYFLRQLSVFAVLVVASAAAAFAQTPNTGSIVVVAQDQNGAVVIDARVSVANSATGGTRDAVTGSDGSTTIPGLSLTGTYTVTVSKDGFANEQRRDITLRSGETATLRVTLSVGTSKAVVTVVGTTEGVHANPQVGLPLQTSQINETPILGRKVSTLPLLNSAFRQGKGTGDLFVNSTYFITGVGSRRATTFTLDGANNDEAWGRQTAITTLPLNAVQEVNVLSNAFSAEYGWTS
ncbi:MAG TPA: carboxypeptidase-like regulatory domain-containing protein, partial [Pyrinomonadaceae bacterium]|nr:carboxypeptidase-like regulatory domain-containing protein [Pyrinomonadaceae bacterium]